MRLPSWLLCIALVTAGCSAAQSSGPSATVAPSPAASLALPQVSEDLAITGVVNLHFTGMADPGTICRRVTHPSGLWVWIGRPDTTYHFWILIPNFTGTPMTVDPTPRSDAVFIHQATPLMLADANSDHWGAWNAAWITTGGSLTVDSVDPVAHVVSGTIAAELTEELHNKGAVHVSGRWSCPYDPSEPQPLLQVL